MESTILESLTGIGAFAQYFFGAIVLLVIFIFIYGVITPYHEYSLIKEGKTAPAVSLGGAILGYIFPMCSAITHSASFIDMIIWACIAMAVQILVFLVMRIFFHELIKNVSEDKIGPALFLAIVSIGMGLLNAACMVY